MPRAIGPADAFRSARVGIRFVTLPVKIFRSSGSPRLATISPIANTPTATTMKPMPSDSSVMPNEKRCTPVLTSVPTMPSRRPITTMASDLRMSPWARTAAATRPISISEKYSGAPNFSATSASGGPAMAISSVPKVPATNEPMAAMASAGPARPCRAIW